MRTMYVLLGILLFISLFVPFGFCDITNLRIEFGCSILSNPNLSYYDNWQNAPMDMIYVDDENINGPWDGSKDYPYMKIQDGIDVAEDFDVVYVRSGFYDENIVINKTISLIGENKNTTIIDGGKITDVVTILSNDVFLSGFTIQNSANISSGFWWKAGIRVLGSSAIIEDNIIKNNLLGIFAKQVNHLIIRFNYFFNDSISIYPYDGENESRPLLKREHYIHTIEHNFVNSKPLIYLIDKSDIEISDAGQIFLVNCTRIIIVNLSLSNADFPLILVSCSHCHINNVSFFENDGECTLLNSDENSISSCLFQHNFHGILLDYFSERNQIYYNTFLQNHYCGAICEYFSNENIFYKNNFIDNTWQNAYLIGAFKNRWEQNYWSDWIGLFHPMFENAPKVIPGTLFDSHQRIRSLFNIDSHPVTHLL